MKTFEQELNRVIANGAQIQERMSGLGNVLPTAASLRANDKWAADQTKANGKFANTTLSHCERRTVNGEVRYYSGNRYAVVRAQRARWFEVRPNGDYAI